MQAIQIQVPDSHQFAIPIHQAKPRPPHELLPINDAIRIKAAEYWLKLGEADFALKELEALPSRIWKCGWSLKTRIAAIGALRERKAKELGPEGCSAFSPLRGNNEIDNTHLNPQGRFLFAPLVVEELLCAVPELKPCFRNESTALATASNPRLNPCSPGAPAPVNALLNEPYPFGGRPRESIAGPHDSQPTRQTKGNQQSSHQADSP